MKNKIIRVSLTLLTVLTLVFAASLAAEGDNGSAQGKTKASAIVLLPLPFDQETGTIAIESQTETLWYLFYASQGQDYVFEFVGEEADGILKTEIIGLKDTAELDKEQETPQWNDNNHKPFGGIQRHIHIEVKLPDRDCLYDPIEYDNCAYRRTD